MLIGQDVEAEIPGVGPDLFDTHLEEGAGRRQRRAAETRMKIFRSALRLFCEKGFSSVTVGEITAAADVGKGTFFNYFESKEHVLGVMAELQHGRIRSFAPLVEAGELSIREILLQLAHSLTEEPGRSPELARTMVSAFLASKVVRDLLNRKIAVGRTMLAEYIAEGRKRAEIDPNLCNDAVALQFQQAVMGTILFWSLHGGRPLSAWIDESFQHFWRAVANPGRERMQ